MSLICEESHHCFGKDPPSAHQTSHLCFGKRHRPQLEPLEAHAVASVLEDAVDQLAILGKTLPEASGCKQSHDGEGFRDVDTRFGKPPSSPRVYSELAGRWPPHTEAMLKVQCDRVFAEVILEDLLTELRQKGSFGSLRMSLDWQDAMIADEHKLLKDHGEALEKRKDLSKQLAGNRRNILDQRTFWEKKTELLTSNLYDSYLLGGLAICYANAWEHNRREQQGLVLGRKENALHDAMERIKDPEAPNEERVHWEIMQFLAKDTEMLKKDLNHWTDLYDAEMMQREIEIMQLQSKLDQQKEEHREMREEERRRQEIIEKSNNLRADYEERRKIISSVVAIQAWWRGVSYRAGIKMVKPKKGRKKTKKKKGKRKLKK